MTRAHVPENDIRANMLEQVAETICTKLPQGGGVLITIFLIFSAISCVQKNSYLGLM